MFKIYLDTSERNKKSVKLVKVLAEQETLLEEITGDIDVVTEIGNLMSKHNLDVKDIEEVVPFLGPGSFTGLKIGVTVANVINWANKKRSIDKMYTPNYGAEPNIQPKKN